MHVCIQRGLSFLARYFPLHFVRALKLTFPLQSEQGRLRQMPLTDSLRIPALPYLYAAFQPAYLRPEQAFRGQAVHIRNRREMQVSEDCTD